jgi:nucleotide-binding universal stress UspA family protein
MALVLAVKDMVGLADLYAVGVVGAIATNLGATATDKTAKVARSERLFMFMTFLVMGAIEISLLLTKPNARYFAFTILAVGLVLRGLVQERRAKKASKTASDAMALPSATQLAAAGSNSEQAMLCAIRSRGRTLDFALREARETGRRLYLLFVREQRFMTDEDRTRRWTDDAEASTIFNAVRRESGERSPLFCYAVGESAATTIVDIAATLGASRLILGAPRRNAFLGLLHGDVIREVSHQLPEEIDLLVYA